MYFDKCEISGEVFSIKHGKGKIKGIRNDDSEYKIICKFEYDVKEYTLDGMSREDKIQTLFYMDTDKHLNALSISDVN